MTDYKKMQELINKVAALKAEPDLSASVNFQIWHNDAERLLKKHYGVKSHEAKSFSDMWFTSVDIFMASYEERRDCYINGLDLAEGYFRSYLNDMTSNPSDTREAKSYNNSSVFIVHGHDELLKTQVARLVEQQGLEAIILSEKENEGKTIIEKLEAHTNVGAAIVLFTPDDSGKANKEEEYKQRARQNVILEAGFFMGLLGRNRVIMLVSDESVEIPSDLKGIVYTVSDMWQYKVVRELKVMGFNVTLDKVTV